MGIEVGLENQIVKGLGEMPSARTESDGLEGIRLFGKKGCPEWAVLWVAHDRQKLVLALERS